VYTAVSARRFGDLLRGKDVQELECLNVRGLGIEAISELTGYYRKMVSKYLDPKGNSVLAEGTAAGKAGSAQAPI
jgi:hypothetical protein